MNLVPCTCGAQVANDGGSDHPLLGAYPPCWARFEDVEARAQKDCPELVAELNDAYVAQHAEGFEKNAAHREAVSRAVKREVNSAPRDMGRLTVFDVPLKRSTYEFVASIHAWADEVRRVWSSHSNG